MVTRTTAKKTHRVGKALGVFLLLILLAVGVYAFTIISQAGTRAVMAFGSDDEFGLGGSKASTTTSVALLADADETDVAAASSALSAAASRDITSNIDSINAYLEEERRKAEEALRAEEEATLKAVNARIAEQRAGAGIPYGLDNVDWSVGKEAFIREWADRINAYMEGYPLAGYGEVFATAAWEHKVDPRLSPAISRTESTSGLNCFRWHNAWGWGNTGWSSWEEAINAHVAGLEAGYSYTVSKSFARIYCPPTYETWYANTYSEMLNI